MHISKTLPFLAAGLSLAAASGTAYAQRVEHDNQQLAFQGKWTPVEDAKASGGSFTVSNFANDAVSFVVTGSNFVLYRKMDPNGGKANVMVDGKDFGEISFYAQEPRWQVPAVVDMDELGAARHTIELRVSSFKPAGSSGNNVYFDALEHPAPANIPVSAVIGTVTSPGELQRLAVTRTNYWRAKIGLPPVRHHLALGLAAYAHAKYLDYSRTNGLGFNPHVEAFGANPNFTGIQPGDRAVYFGFGKSIVAEDVTIHADPVRFVDGWMAGVYHREPFVNRFNTNIGFGGFPDGGTMDFASNISQLPYPDAVTVITFPADGQTDVPLTYDGSDGPNNVTGGNAYGFPISLRVDKPARAEDKDPLGPTTATLAEAANPANTIPVTIADPTTDNSLSSFFMIPNQPLAPATTYVATMSGTDPSSIGGAGGTKFTKTWRFTTSNVNAIYAERAVKVGDGAYRFNWDMYTGAVPSQLEYGPDTNYGTVVAGELFPGRQTTFTAAGPDLKDRPVLHWRITSRDAQGNTFATPDHVIIKATAPPAPPAPDPTPAPGVVGERLTPGQVLSPNTQLQSPNKAYRLLYQPNGNLVLHRVADNSVIWESKTAGQTASRVIMQADGNLVMYGVDNNAQWHTATFGSDNSSALLQDDGKLVIVNSIGQIIWENGVVPPNQTALPVRPKLIPGASLLPGQALVSVNGTYRLVYQTDGNLVVYQGNDALWSSGTPGKDPGRVCMQTDGNLVMYGKDGAPQWFTSTNSAANANSELIMQTDGNLVMYNPSGRPVWFIR